MKKTIDEKQLRELTPEGMKKLEKIMNKNTSDEKYMWPVSSIEITIGWMIEYLNEQDISIDITEMWNMGKIEYLCDHLWEAVKTNLNDYD